MDKDPLPLGLAAVLALIIVAAAVFAEATTIPFQHAAAKAGGLVASVFVIMVFVERSLAILNDVWFDERHE